MRSINFLLTISKLLHPYLIVIIIFSHANPASTVIRPVVTVSNSNAMAMLIDAIPPLESASIANITPKAITAKGVVPATKVMPDEAPHPTVN